MTETPRERYKRLLPVIEAWCRGEVVELKSSNAGWIEYKMGDCPSATWPNWKDTDWRIKPKAREMYLLQTADGVYHNVNRDAFPNGDIIHVREVVKESK